MMPHAGAEGVRQRNEPWRLWYGLQQWKDLRWSILVRDRFICQICKRLEPDTSQLVADHKIAHKGDIRLFWDAANLHCLCRLCHDSVKQSEEKSQRMF